MASNLGDMVVSIVGDTTGLNKSLTDSQKKMAAFGVNVAAVTAAVVQLGKVAARSVKEFSDYGSAIYDAGQKTGLSTDSIQEWKFIAEQTGTTLESVTGAVGMMTRGLETNKKMFADLGIELKNADGTFRSTTDIFNDTVSTLSGMTDETERDAAAFKLLGRSAQSLIPILNAGESGIKGMKDEARSLGIILDKETISNADQLGDSMDALKASLTSAKNNMVNDMAPALIKIANGLKDLIERTVSSKKEWEAFVKATKGQVTTQEELSLAIKGAVTETARLQSLNKELYSEGQFDEQIAASQALEKSLRAQAVALASASAANAMGTESAKKKAEADQAAADDASQSAIAAQKFADEELIRLQEVSDAELQANLQWVTMQQQNTEVATWEADYIISEDKRKTDELIKNAQEYANSYVPLMQNVSDVTKAIFSQLGTDLANQELSWQSLGTAAINSIGAIVSAMGDQLAAKAATRYIEAIADLASIVYAPLAPGEFASAALLTGGAAAAWAAGAALQAVKLEDGGVVMPKSGGTLAQIAEAGQPEAVIPLDKLDGMGGQMHLVVNLDSRPLLDKIFEATKNRTVLISAGAVV